MLNRKIKNFMKALAVFSGTIIGVGLFGLPYVAMKAGFLMVVGYFAVLTIFVVVFHQMLGKVALGTDGLKRIPGYVEEYLGPRAKKLSLVVAILGIFGALLAYLIVGGEFLKLFFAPYLGGSGAFYTFLYFGAGAFLIYRGTKDIVNVELLMLLAFVVISVILFIKAVPLINLGNLGGLNWQYFAMPYGVIMFSLWGLSLVPELEELVEYDRKQMMRVIACGIVLAAAFYLVFIVAILGTTGASTTKDGLSGFFGATGNGIVRLGLIFGFLTTFTSFIALGMTLKKILHYDAKISQNIAWMIVCFVPLALYLINIRDFIGVIGIVGSLMLGIEGVLVVFVYRNFIKIKLGKSPPKYIYLLLAIFGIGIFLELWHLF